MPDLLSFLGEIASRSSLVLAVACACLSAMRRASASERHLVLLLALFITALIPAGLLLSPKVTWMISLPQQVQNSPSPPRMTAHVLHENEKIPLGNSAPVVESKPSLVDFCTTTNGLMALLVGGMLMQVAMLGRAAWTWRRIRQHAEEALLPDSVLEPARAFAGGRRIPSIFTSDQISVPLLSGWWRPAIILPADASKWPSKRLLMALCHELAHFRRGDSWLLPLICILRVLYWWHPVVWLALARLRRERENACDDLVLNQNFRATDYADLIVDTARHAHEFRWQNGALAMASTSCVCERIGAILNPTLNRRDASQTTIIAGLFLAFALGWLFVATQVQAEDQSLSSGSTPATNALKPQIHLDFTLVEIDEKTYQHETTAIDEAVKNGNIAFLINLHGASVLSSPSVTTQGGLKADISFGKELIQGDKSTPVTNLTATSVLGANGKVIPTVVQSQSKGPTNMLLGVDLETTPSVSKDGVILLPIRYRIGYIPHYQSPDDFDARNTTADKKLSVVDGQASGFWVGEKDAPVGKLFPYSLTSILNSPGEEQIKTLPPLSPSPNRLVLIVNARRVSPEKTTPVPKVLGEANGPKPAVNFHVVLVDVDEKVYEREAAAMDEAIRKGDLLFFDNPKDGWVFRTADLNLFVGQPGWYSEGSVQSYVDSAKQEMRNGKPWTTLRAKAVFLGLNADFSWSKDRLMMNSTWSVTEPASYRSLGEKAGNGAISPGDLPEVQFHVASYADKAWDMTPGKEHAFWVGETLGVLRKSPMSVDEMIKNRMPSRLAVFLTVQPVKNPRTP